MSHSAPVNYYDKLGVRSVINGWGGSTILGGSTPAPHVRESMEMANDVSVEMGDLMQRAGDYIAGRLGAEAAYIASGAAAALALSTAACMAGDDPEKIGRLPDTTGMKNEVIIQRAQRYRYDRCFTIPGAKLVDAGDASGCTAEQFAAAIGPRTAAVAYPATLAANDSVLSLEDAVAMAHEHDVPVIVDAANQIYPIDRFFATSRSGDLVNFCAKYFDGPQSTGIVCGSREMIDLVTAQGFTAFHTAGATVIEAMVPDGRAWGRTMKIDRQEIVGCVAAFDTWLDMDHEERLSEIEGKLHAISEGLRGVPGVQPRIYQKDVYWVHELEVKLDVAVVGKTAEQVAAELDSGNPRVWVAFFGNDTIIIKSNALPDDEVPVLTQRLKAALTV